MKYFIRQAQAFISSSRPHAPFIQMPLYANIDPQAIMSIMIHVFLSIKQCIYVFQ